MTRFSVRSHLLGLLALSVLAACSATSPTPDQVERGPLGKADTSGSCQNTSCDGVSPGGSCWCDDACISYGDCCTDRPALCEPINQDALAAMSSAQLDAVFKYGTAPVVADLGGQLSGRSLANAIVPLGPLQDALNLIANATWLGKTFTPLTSTTGTGFNRVKIGFELKVAYFDAELGTGRDGQPSLHLNYDVDQNPIGVRNIRDEVREVAPGLYLGKAFFHTSLGEPALFFFSLTKPL